MNYGICNLSVIPVRKSADHCSEMVTQLFFGESFEIIEYQNNWIFIKIHYDNYQGWIHHLQYLTLNKDNFAEFKKQSKVLIYNNSSHLTEISSGKLIHLLLGFTIPLPNHSNNLTIGNTEFHLNGEYFTPDSHKKEIIKFAANYLNVPYLWGGRTQFGIDCSGFTQMVYKLAGIILPRDASQQALIGETLSFLSEAEPGDLIFFDNENGNISHVGILYDSQHIIHASGCVRIDSIDHNGIYNTDLKKYTHPLRLIKRVLG